MKLVQLIELFRKRLKVVVWISYAVLALLVALDALPFIVDKEQAHTQAEHIPGFWSVFGFVACVLIIILSKWYGHAGIMQREDYYDE
jgi:hypothetical protein